jgi:hypothetical protein
MQGSDLTPTLNPGYQSWMDKFQNAMTSFGKQQLINATPAGKAYSLLTDNSPTWLKLARGGAGLYAANEQMNQAQANQDAIQQQQRQLSDMYGPNSPYAAQLKQALARRDAKAGRLSQYGPREVELQAQLAKAASGAAPAMASLGNANTQAINAQGAARNQGLNALLTMAPVAAPYVSDAYNGLKDVYNNW